MVSEHDAEYHNGEQSDHNEEHSSALPGSMVNAITHAPNTMNGERINRRSTRFTPFCT